MVCSHQLIPTLVAMSGRNGFELFLMIWIGVGIDQVEQPLGLIDSV